MTVLELISSLTLSLKFVVLLLVDPTKIQLIINNKSLLLKIHKNKIK